MPDPIAYTNVTDDDWVIVEDPPEPETPTPPKPETRDTFIVGNERGEDVALRHGHRYTIRTPYMSLRGTFDAYASSPARLRFRGLYADEWFVVHHRDVRDAYPA